MVFQLNKTVTTDNKFNLDNNSALLGKMQCLNLSESDMTRCLSDIVDKLNIEKATQFWPVIIFMILLFIIGVTGNALVIIVYATKTNTSRANISMFSLALVDFFSCLLIHPYIIYKLFHEYTQNWVVVCKIFEFFIHSSLSVSNVMLVCIAYDRFRSICKPLQFYSGKMAFTRLIVASFVIGFLGSVPILIFYGSRTELVKYGGLSLHTQHCDYSDQYSGTLAPAIFGCIACICFIFSVIFMAVMYWRLASVVRKSKQVGPMIAQPRAGREESSTSDFQPLSQISKIPVQTVNEKKSMPEPEIKHPIPFLHPVQTSTLNSGPPPTKTAKILFMVTAVFLLSWLPFWIIRFISLSHTDFLSAKRYDGLKRFLVHLFYLNNAVNPIIYTGMNKRFCDDLKVLKHKIQRAFQ